MSLNVILVAFIVLIVSFWCHFGIFRLCSVELVILVAIFLLMFDKSMTCGWARKEGRMDASAQLLGEDRYTERAEQMEGETIKSRSLTDLLLCTAENGQIFIWLWSVYLLYGLCQVVRVCGCVAVYIWCHYVVIFVSFWCHYGVILVSFWCHFCVIMVSFLCHFGVIMVSFWCHFGVILVSFWCHFDD